MMEGLLSIFVMLLFDVTDLPVLVSCCCCRYSMYLGLAFFLLVAAYISFRRTPDFIKQPVYALLHMKQGGQPFTQQGRAVLAGVAGRVGN
jgi:hypothetical protein